MLQLYTERRAPSLGVFHTTYLNHADIFKKLLRLKPQPVSSTLVLSILRLLIGGSSVNIYRILYCLAISNLSQEGRCVTQSFHLQRFGI